MSRPTSKKRLRVLLPLGCLTLLFAPLLTSWVTLRFLQPAPATPPPGPLSWSRDYRARPPSSETPSTSRVGTPTATFLLPEVLSVEDAVEWEEGWILLDRRLGRLHVLHGGSGLVRSLGREGQGPGELEEPVSLTARDSLIWVLNQRGLVLDRFSLAEGFRERTRLYGGGCMVGLAKEILALPSGELLLLRVCPATLPGPGTAWVERIDPQGLLKPILSLPLGKPGSRRLVFLREPSLAAGEDGVFLGTWDAPCIVGFTTDGARRGHRCLPDYPRPETPRQERTALERRFQRVLRLGLLSLEVPEHLPWFDGVFATSRGLVARRLRGEEDRDLVLLRPNGTISVTNKRFPKGTFVGERSILTVEELLQGTRIRLFPSPWG